MYLDHPVLSCLIRARLFPRNFKIQIKSPSSQSFIITNHLQDGRRKGFDKCLSLVANLELPFDGGRMEEGALTGSAAADAAAAAADMGGSEE